MRQMCSPTMPMSRRWQSRSIHPAAWWISGCGLAQSTSTSGAVSIHLLTRVPTGAAVASSRISSGRSTATTCHGWRLHDDGAHWAALSSTASFAGSTGRLSYPRTLRRQRIRRLRSSAFMRALPLA